MLFVIAVVLSPYRNSFPEKRIEEEFEGGERVDKMRNESKCEILDSI